MILGTAKRQKEGAKPTPTRFRSDRQEKQVAKATGGKQTPNSGATMFGGKGDVLTDDFLLECKTKMTHSDSISLKREWFEKNKQEKIFMGKEHSAVVFNFGPDEPNYYVIDEYLFQDLLEYLQSKEDR